MGEVRAYIVISVSQADVRTVGCVPGHILTREGSVHDRCGGRRGWTNLLPKPKQKSLGSRSGACPSSGRKRNGLKVMGSAYVCESWRSPLRNSKESFDELVLPRFGMAEKANQMLAMTMVPLGMKYPSCISSSINRWGTPIHADEVYKLAAGNDRGTCLEVTREPTEKVLVQERLRRVSYCSRPESAGGQSQQRRRSPPAHASGRQGRAPYTRRSCAQLMRSGELLDQLRPRLVRGK